MVLLFCLVSILDLFFLFFVKFIINVLMWRLKIFSRRMGNTVIDPDYVFRLGLIDFQRQVQRGESNLIQVLLLGRRGELTVVRDSPFIGFGNDRLFDL